MSTTVYIHPDGYRVSYSYLSSSLECYSGEDELAIDIPIGEIGLILLGRELIKIGSELQNLAQGAA